MPTRPARLRRLLESPALAFLMEAHNALERAHRRGGRLRRHLGERSLDRRRRSAFATPTKRVDAGARCRSSSWPTRPTSPILLDGDTGYGNFNNVRRLVAKLEQRGIAGVCLEDKLFPKTNSFLHGEAQPLAAVDEFCGRIRAARTRSAIPTSSSWRAPRRSSPATGWPRRCVRARGATPMPAPTRFSSTARSGHRMRCCRSSRRGTGRCRCVVVPTKYCDTPTARVSSGRVCRADLGQPPAAREHRGDAGSGGADLRRSSPSAGIEPAIAPMAEVFRLQRVDELESAEQRYLSSPPPVRPAVNQ